MSNIARLAAALISLLAFWPSLAFAQAMKAGVVTTLEGRVTVTRVTLAPQPLKFRDDVFVDYTVTTGDQSIARMLLGGKAVVTVRERSRLTITEVPGKATIDLQAGKIALAVAKDKMRSGESIEIRAANVVAGIRGTVVVAEVSSAAAQAGGAVGPTGTLWVLKGLALANSFTGVGSVAGTNVVPPPPVVVTGAPILPGNRPITGPPRPVTSSPVMPPPSQHHNRPDGCDRGI